MNPGVKVFFFYSHFVEIPVLETPERTKFRNNIKSSVFETVRRGC